MSFEENIVGTPMFNSSASLFCWSVALVTILNSLVLSNRKKTHDHKCLSKKNHIHYIVLSPFLMCTLLLVFILIMFPEYSPPSRLR